MKVYLSLLGILCYSTTEIVDVTYGFVHFDSDNIGHVYLATPLHKSSTLWLQWPDEQGVAYCCEKLNLTQLQETKDIPKYNVISNSGTIIHYLIHNLPRPVTDPMFIGIAISGDVIFAQNIYQLQSKTSNSAVSAKLCFGTEGMNLIIREKYRYNRIYLHFDYDIEESPECTDNDFISAIPHIEAKR